MNQNINIFPSPLSNDFFFEVETINVLSKNEKFKEEIHRHDYYELFFFIEGHGEHVIDFNTHKISRNTIQLVCPFQVHSIKRNAQTHGYVIKFNEQCITDIKVKKLLSEYLYQSVPQSTELSEIESNELISLIKIIHSDFMGDLKSNFISHCLQSILIYCIGKNNHSNISESKLTDNFLKLLDENFKAQSDVSFYVNELNMDIKKINNELKQRFGLTAKQKINFRRLLEAKRLLAHSNLSIKEIAYDLNFKSSAHFSNFFRKETGKYPTKL